MIYTYVINGVNFNCEEVITSEDGAMLRGFSKPLCVKLDKLTVKAKANLDLIKELEADYLYSSEAPDETNFRETLKSAKEKTEDLFNLIKSRSYESDQTSLACQEAHNIYYQLKQFSLDTPQHINENFDRNSHFSRDLSMAIAGSFFWGLIFHTALEQIDYLKEYANNFSLIGAGSVLFLSGGYAIIRDHNEPIYRINYLHDSSLDLCGQLTKIEESFEHIE